MYLLKRKSPCKQGRRTGFQEEGAGYEEKGWIRGKGLDTRKRAGDEKKGLDTRKKGWIREKRVGYEKKGLDTRKKGWI